MDSDLKKSSPQSWHPCNEKNEEEDKGGEIAEGIVIVVVVVVVVVVEGEGGERKRIGPPRRHVL